MQRMPFMRVAFKISWRNSYQGEKIIRNSEYINPLDLTGQELAVNRLDDQAHVTPTNRARKDTYANGQHYDAPPEQHCLSFLAIEQLDLSLDKMFQTRATGGAKRIHQLSFATMMCFARHNPTYDLIPKK